MSQDGSRPILAIQTRNCVKFLRVTYYFDVVVTKDILEKFKNFKIEINEFSKFVSNAKDHYKMASFEPAIIISGVLLEKSFEVSYGKFSSSEHESAREWFESELLRLDFGNFFHKKNKEQSAAG